MRLFGANVVDVLVVVASLAVGTLVPAQLEPGDERLPAAPSLLLVSARLSAGLVNLSFSAPLLFDNPAWADGIEVSDGRRPLKIAASRIIDPQTVEFLVVEGATATQPLHVRIPQDGPFRTADGVPLAEAVDLSLAGSSDPRALPSPRVRLQGAYIDGATYAFGGGAERPPLGGGVLDQIVRIGPGDEGPRIMNATLPARLTRHAVAVDPTQSDACPRGCAYIFGGEGPADDAPQRAHVVRYDPVGDVATPMKATLGGGPTDVVVAAHGGFIYVVGGLQPDSTFMHRYDPRADTMTELPVRLPYPLYAAGGFTDPRVTPSCPVGCVYIMGGTSESFPQAGQSSAGRPPVDVLRFEPLTGALTALPVQLPGRLLYFGQAAFDGTRAFMISGPIDMASFDPLTLETAHVPGPPGTTFGAAGVLASTAEGILTAGGYNHPDWVDRIIVFRPT